MTNDEIRRKIAEIKGYKWYEIGNEATLCNTTYAGILPKGREIVERPSLKSKIYYHCPNWPESIADAWELVEEMKQIGGAVCVEWTIPFIDAPFSWWCGANVPKNENKWYSGRDQTAPLAICLAYIAWKESQNA